MRHRVPRPGRPLRQMMEDPRWAALPLSARGLWAEMSVMADSHPALRQPTENAFIGLARLAAHVQADQGDTLRALSFLCNVGICSMANPDTITLRAF